MCAWTMYIADLLKLGIKGTCMYVRVYNEVVLSDV